MSTKILDTAKELVGGERTEQYGPPLDDFRCVAALWSAWLSRKHRKEVKIDPLDVPILMVLLKTSRQANAWKDDNLVDIAGYAECAAMAKEHADGGVYVAKSDNTIRASQIAAAEVTPDGFLKLRRESAALDEAEHTFAELCGATAGVDGRFSTREEVAETRRWRTPVDKNGDPKSPVPVPTFEEQFGVLSVSGAESVTGTLLDRVDALEALTVTLTDAISELEEKEATRQAAEEKSQESLKELIDSLAGTL